MISAQTQEFAQEMKALEYGLNKDGRRAESVDREMRFTEVYREYEHANPFEREIACLRAQVPGMLLPMREGDWFAGRLDRPLVGIDPEQGDLTEAAYYCRFATLEKQLENPDIDPILRKNIKYLLEFWKERVTYHKCRAAFNGRMSEGLPGDAYYQGLEISYPMYGLGGPCLDFEKLVRLGIGGLRLEVEEKMGLVSPKDRDATAFYQSLLDALDIFSDAALGYAEQADQLACGATSEKTARRALLAAESLRHVAARAPSSYHQAIQLVWLYALVSLVKNYGRMDLYLGDLLARDLDNKVISYDEARDMTAGLWRLMIDRGNNFNSRVFIGGRGRPNPEAADRFAFLALDVQEHVRDILPQLSLRWHRGMAPALFKRSLDIIAAGSTFPVIYNDDINIPAIEKGFAVSHEEAEQYLPYGCGEYVIDHLSVGSPDAALNALKALDVTLRNGVDSFTGDRRGLALGHLRDFSTFEHLWNAFARQIDNETGLLAECQETIYRITGQEAAFPFLSLLYDDCIGRGKPLLAGGARYLGGTLESFGNNSAADSLLAIKKAVYEKKLVSADELIAVLDADFEGHERVRKILLSQPKYGNDDPEADAMSVRFNTMACETARRHGKRVGLHTFSIVLINNGDSVLFGKTTAASADGRKCGFPLSNGNQPGAGMDTAGITALLNSMAKLDPALHAGAVHNVKFNRKMFVNKRAEVESLLRGYFAAGGTQIMITVADRGELEAAMKEPEKYANLIVRVGGYSERFVDLPRDIQLEVIRRTLY